MADQAKLTAEERAETLVAWLKREAEYDKDGDRYYWMGITVWLDLKEEIAHAIRQAEDAMREEMGKPPIAGCCGGEVILHPARIHHKEGCPIKTQAIRENK